MQINLAFLLILIMFVFLIVNSMADVNVLVLCGNISQAEFPVLSKFTDINGQKVKYEQTKDRNLPGLDKLDILWLGQGEVCENAYFFNKDIEDKIKQFVKAGGIVISVGQDSDDGRPCEVGWLTAMVTGIERGGTESFNITDVPEAKDLFKKPNEIKTAHFDDAWTQPDKSYIVLATINNGQDVGVALLKSGKGWYILTSIENENDAEAASNTLIMENLMHYAVNLIQHIGVEYRGKLSMCWGGIKSIY